MQGKQQGDQRARSSRDLTSGPVVRSLAGLTAPMMLGVSSSILVSMLEIGFIGQLGTDQVAAISFTFPVTMALSSIALGISIGSSSVIARRVGAGDWAAVRHLSTHSLLLVALLMTLISLLGYLTVDPLFRLLGAPDHILDHIDPYMALYYPGTVLFTVGMVAGSVIRATGNAKVPGLVMTFGALLNLLLDPLFIFGWFGFPRLELVGAAAAMVLSRVATLTALLYYTGVRERMILMGSHALKGVIDSWRQILTVGFPAMATQMIGPITGGIITRLLAVHGENVVAGFGVASRIEAVAVMLLFALSGSIGPFVGQNWGAGAHDRVQEGVRAAYRFCIYWGLFVCAVLFFTASSFVPWIDDNPIVVKTAVTYLTIVPLSYGIWGVLMMASASFNSLGKPIPSTVMSFTRMFVLYVPLATLGNYFYGYGGIFLATAAANLLMGGVGYVWLKSYLGAQATLQKTG